jgi:hypothetical protein
MFTTLTLTPRARAMLTFIARRANEGDPVTCVDVANEFPVDSVMFGRQRDASTMIAWFRSRGLLEDVRRCSHCGGARTRGERNVKLYPTLAGLQSVLDILLQPPSTARE